MNVDYYNKNRKESWSPLISHNGSICGFWWFGRWYNTSRLDGKYFYGAYPWGFLDRVRLLFREEFDNGKILHLFSGTLKGDNSKIITFDMNPELKPNIIGNAENIDEYFSENTFDLILADPPYDNNYIKYGTPKFSKKKVIYKCSKILKEGGILAWLDTLIPQWANKDGWKYKGNIGIAQSTNHKVRGLTILEK